jgi:SAM-dependent methyltransferase
MSDTKIREEDFFNFLLADANAPFSGWNFSYITTTGRMAEAPPSWSYASILLNYFRNTQSLLDMGTGGGEFLSFLHPLPTNTCATEGYAPNVPIARQRLEPLGIKVYEARGNAALPFANNQFDLVINRHEAYSAREVWRILKPGGQFITQQVGGSNCTELNSLMGAPPYQYSDWQLDYAVQELQDAGWHIITQREDHPVTRFFDVGALIYYLKAIPWQVSDFSLEKYFDRLVELHNKIQQEHYLTVHDHRFLIIARKL